MVLGFPDKNIKTGILGTKTTDLNTVEGLAEYARQSGLGKEVEQIVGKKEKLTLLQRLGKGLGALNPAEAILTGQEQGLGTGVKTYVTGALRDVASAVTGTDYNAKRRYFSDVAEKAGIENKIAKFGIGFVGDVLLDPSTYFGGAIAKGVGKVVGKGGEAALKGIGKLAPETETALRTAGTGLQDAVGSAFKYAYKATKGAKEDVLSFLSKQQKDKLELAASNLDRLGTGVLTPDQRTELALKMVAGKRAEFAAREAGMTSVQAAEVGKATALKGTTEKVKGLIESQVSREKEFAKLAGLENSYEIYFPFIKKDKVDKFIKQTQGIKVGSEGYKKQFKNLLTNENIELDPAKAFFTREAQIVSNANTRKFLGEFVETYGKKLDEFENVDEARKAGYELIKEGGMFGKDLGYVPKFDAKLIRDSISPDFQTLNMLAKATGFDAITSLFKRSVTGLFAPFHVRNFMSGIMQNFEVLGIDALNPKNISIGQKIAYKLAKGESFSDDIMKVAGTDMKFSDIMKPFADRFSGDTFYMADFDDALKAGEQLKQVAKTFSKQSLKETIKTGGLGTNAIPFRIGRAVGNFIEQGQKATAYITAIQQGKPIKVALDLAEKAGFDYRALTRFESQIMKRLIPFYSFTRKNLGLQLKTLGENPQRINQIMKFFENVSSGIGGEMSEEEKKQIPTFIKEALGVKLKDSPEGLKRYIATFGTPIEAFTSLFSGNPILRGISMTNPILKVPVELGIGKDSFRQKDIKEVYNASEYKLAPQIVKDLLMIKEVKKDNLKNVNGKLVKVGERTEYVADPYRLLIARSLFTSRGVSYLDQVFSNDLKGLLKVLKTTTGIKPMELNLESLQAIEEKKQRRGIEDLFLKKAPSQLRVFTKPYIPKE